MPRLFRKIPRILSKTGILYTRLRYFIKKKLGLLRPPKILPYTGFGNTKKLQLRGIVLEDKGIAKPQKEDSIWQNMVAMYKRYTSESIPHVKLKANFQGLEKEVTTDENGYFSVEFQPPNPIKNNSSWQDVDLELLDKVVKKQQQVKATGKVLIPNETLQFGVISDVDDTILVSKATNFRKKIRLMLLKNAHTRLPFKGVSAFYCALRKGNTGKEDNPIFYVSSSSWKLYDLLIDFCLAKNIPMGPFLLRNSRLDQFKFLSSIHKVHKMEKIESIIATYKDLKFILIGDSGQKDTEIYHQVVKDFPGRVLAIYIRHVSTEARESEIKKISEKLSQQNIPLVLVKDTNEAALHALKHNFIHPDCISEISKEIKLEEHTLSPIEHIVGVE
ncbi:App1 family protein [soil metagenome]